jgi:hypothetical protein
MPERLELERALVSGRRVDKRDARLRPQRVAENGGRRTAELGLLLLLTWARLRARLECWGRRLKRCQCPSTLLRTYLVGRRATGTHLAPNAALGLLRSEVGVVRFLRAQVFHIIVVDRTLNGRPTGCRRDDGSEASHLAHG